LEPLFVYDAPPKGESRFDFPNVTTYRREICRCKVCGHCISIHDWNMDNLYKGEYAQVKYPGDTLRQTFERLITLQEEQSDNADRVKRILAFAIARFSGLPATQMPAVLDIGSGVCVFLHRMKQVGWQCTALDPDPRAAAHARDVVGVTALCGDFLSSEGLGRYHLLTFNKVLEHVADPVSMLAKAREHLVSGGFVYVELPDAEEASKEGSTRSEFFIEHRHVFSLTSFGLLAMRAGFTVNTIERVHEPSGKYTLRGFLVQ